MNGKPLTYKSWLPMSRRECGAGQAGPVSGNRPALGGVAGPPNLEDGGSRCESPAQNAMKINMPISRLTLASGEGESSAASQASHDTSGPMG